MTADREPRAWRITGQGYRANPHIIDGPDMASGETVEVVERSPGATVEKLRSELATMANRNAEAERSGYDKGWLEGRAYETQTHSGRSPSARDREAGVTEAARSEVRREVVAEVVEALRHMPPAVLADLISEQAEEVCVEELPGLFATFIEREFGGGS